MKRYFLIFTLILFACSDGSDDSSDVNNGGGSGNETVNLFFSEYAEGSSNNKYVEIYNPSSRTVNLNNYQIKGTNNGTAWGDNGERELALGGTLAANSVYIICTDAADPAIIAKADLALPYESPVHYNGNDAIAIFGIDGSGNFTVIMDVIGVQSSDPGPAGWNVAGVTGATKDHTLVRKSSINKGNTNWENSAGTSASDSEWEVKDIDDWTSLGTR
jgi:predicted extracellular nuclease